MSGIYNHRPMVPAHGVVGTGSRFSELLESAKNEYETVMQDMNMYKMQRDDLDHKLSQQLQEVSQFQQTLYELERNHIKIKQQYEEEIMRLRRELEKRSVNPTGPSGTTASTPAPLPPPNLGITNPGTFSGGLAPMDVSSSPASAAPGITPLGSGAAAANGTSTKRARGEHGQPHSPVLQAEDGRDSKSELKRKNTNPQTTGASTPNAKPGATEGTDLESSAPHLRKEKDDWSVLWRAQQAITVDLEHTFDHSSVVCCIKFSNDSRYLATGSNHMAQIYDVSSGSRVAEFHADPVRHADDLYIRSVCFSPDSQFLATGAEDRQIRIWDIQKRKIWQTLSGHEQDIYSLDFTKDGRYVCSGSGDRTAKMWHLETGKCIFTMTDESNSKDAGVTSVALSNDGRMVAAGSLDRIVRVWDARNGQFLERFEGHKDSVYSVTFAPDSRTLVSGSLDRTLKLWELAMAGKQQRNNGCRMTFPGHKDFVLSVAFSPDGKWIVSGSKDRTVQFWDPNTGAMQCTLHGHRNSVISVALSPDGSHFATGSGDARARVWKYEPFQG